MSFSPSPLTLTSPRMTTFLDLPEDVHSMIAPYLHQQSLLSLCQTSRRTFDLYRSDLDQRIALDGQRDALGFWKRHCGHAPKLCGHHCANIDFDERKQARRRTIVVKELELYEVAPVVAQPDEPVAATASGLANSAHAASPSASTAAWLETIPGNILGATMAICPNLRKLSVLQSPMPLNAPLAYAMSAWTPKLQTLTFRSPHCDAAALAVAVRNLQALRSLDISSVKTCSCRGPAGQSHGAAQLALAIRNHANLRHLVLNSSKVLGVDDGLFLKVLAGVEPVQQQACMPPSSWHGTASPFSQQQQQAPQVSQAFSQSVHHHQAHHHHLHHHHHRHHHHHHHHHRCRSKNGTPPPSTPHGLTSLELRRSPVNGKVVESYLQSAAAARLRHLFIGGCKSVRAGHLASGTRRSRKMRSSPSRALRPGYGMAGGAKLRDPAMPGGSAPAESAGLSASREPLELEIDGRLLSTEVLLNLEHRIISLRVYEPTEEHVRVLAEVLTPGSCPHVSRYEGDDDSDSDDDDGTKLAQRRCASPTHHLPRLAQLVILPREDDLPRWASAGEATDAAGAPSSSPVGQSLRALLEGMLASRSSIPGNVQTDVAVGDEAWHAMRATKEDLRAWAEHYRRLEEGEGEGEGDVAYEAQAQAQAQGQAQSASEAVPSSGGEERPASETSSAPRRFAPGLGPLSSDEGKGPDAGAAAAMDVDDSLGGDADLSSQCAGTDLLAHGT